MALKFPGTSCKSTTHVPSYNPPSRTLSSMSYKEALMHGILKSPVLKFIYAYNYRPLKSPEIIFTPLELPPIAEDITSIESITNDNDFVSR